MKRHVFIPVLAGLTLGCSATASECVLEVDGQNHAFEHVAVRSEANPYSDGNDFIVHCFREAIPESKATAEDIIWFSPDSGSIEIRLAPGGQVTAVEISTPELTASKSGLGFGVTFDGQLDDDRIRGDISTEEPITSLHNGEETPAWRITATLDAELAMEQ